MLRRSFIELNSSLNSWMRCSYSLPATNWHIPTFRSDSKRATKRPSKNGPQPSSEEHQPTPSDALAHRRTMKLRFPEGWNPPRKLSRDAMEGLRSLHAHDPATFSTPVLADKFQISPEAVRRILKSKWVPNREEKTKLVEKERRRKEEYIQKRIDRERAEMAGRYEDKTAEEERPKSRWEKEDRLTLR